MGTCWGSVGTHFRHRSLRYSQHSSKILFNILSHKFYSFLFSLFQGFSVALFFCFFNSEVKQACRHRFNLWRDSRNLRGNSVRSRRNMSKEYRSRTESVRWVFCEFFRCRFFIILFHHFLDWLSQVLKDIGIKTFTLIVSVLNRKKICKTNPELIAKSSQIITLQSDYTRSYQNDRNVRTRELGPS